MITSYQVVLSAMERSCIPPDSAPLSRTASEVIPTSKIEAVARAKEVAGSWSKEAARGRPEEAPEEEQEIISRPRRQRSDSEGEFSESYVRKSCRV